MKTLMLLILLILSSAFASDSCQCPCGYDEKPIEAKLTGYSSNEGSAKGTDAHDTPVNEFDPNRDYSPTGNSNPTAAAVNSDINGENGSNNKWIDKNSGKWKPGGEAAGKDDRPKTYVCFDHIKDANGDPVNFGVTDTGDDSMRNYEANNPGQYSIDLAVGEGPQQQSEDYNSVQPGIQCTLNWESYQENNCAKEISGCTDSAANNYNSEATEDDGSCTYDQSGCTDAMASNYNASATYDDGSCTYASYGCTDSSAQNYNSSATSDDGSCTYASYGCTDSSAQNYNSSATSDDGSCTYASYGCMDAMASNYDSSATIDNGSCSYNSGCTDLSASNYDSLASTDNGSCRYESYGCMDAMASNYDSSATNDDGSCSYNTDSYFYDWMEPSFTPEYVTTDPMIDVAPSSYSSGCTDPSALNYDMYANMDNGSCLYPFTDAAPSSPETITCSYEEMGNCPYQGF